MKNGLQSEALQHLRQALDDQAAGFRTDQFEAIEQLVSHRNRVLVVQRTGWGKSLVYFIATRLLRDRGAGPTLLISPLLALMRNQIQMAENIGWGEMVYIGKFQRERIPQRLVAASAEMIRDRWQPDPMPAWVTCIPSLNRPELVPDFAARLAQELGISFSPTLQKRFPTDEQKTMQNSYQQLKNIAGSFSVESMPRPGQPVLLVDDIVDSRWTFTVAAAELRQAGSGPVIPFALTTMFGS